MTDFTEAFVAGGLRRIQRLSLLLTAIGAAIAWATLGWKPASSFLLGSAFSLLNFLWLQHSVDKIIAGFLDEQPKRRVWPKLATRYLYLAVVAYVILRGYFASLYAFLAGLFLPIVACMCEAAYEAYVGFRDTSGDAGNH